MLRRICALMMVGMILVGMVPAAAQTAGDNKTLVDKVAGVEQIVYGSVQTGAIVERVSRLERDVYGMETGHTIQEKADLLYQDAFVGKGDKPSLQYRMNSLEWTLAHEQKNEGIKERLDAAEQSLNGTVSSGGIEVRLSRLEKLAYGVAQPVAMPAQVEKDTLVRIKLLTPINTKKNRVGDVVKFQAAEDVMVGQDLVIAKGAVGFGKIKTLEEAHNFGRDGKLEIDFNQIAGLDGQPVPVFLGEKAKKQTQSMATAAGASIVGLAVLGPIGILGGAFVHGKNIDIPAGAEMYVQTRDAVTIDGLQVQ